jgi:hypothetical protein
LACGFFLGGGAKTIKSQTFHDAVSNPTQNTN